jgi:hypothetical protein
MTSQQCITVKSHQCIIVTESTMHHQGIGSTQIIDSRMALGFDQANLNEHAVGVGCFVVEY